MNKKNDHVAQCIANCQCITVLLDRRIVVVSSLHTQKHVDMHVQPQGDAFKLVCHEAPLH